MDYLVYSLPALSGQPLPLELLPPRDLAEAARRGERYARIRTLLRQELSRRSGIPAGDITFTYSEHGKPEFAAQPWTASAWLFTTAAWESMWSACAHAISKSSQRDSCARSSTRPFWRTTAR